MLNTKSIAVTLVLMATTAAVQATDKPQLLFHASYDNGFAADVARGTADATVAFPDSTTLVQGVSGQAVQLDRGGLSYQAIDNLKANMGTIEFWFKPVDWEGSDARTHYLFHTPFNRDSQIIIYRYQRTEKNIGGIFGQFSFYLRSGTKESGGPKLVIPRTRVSDSWKRGEWHYIAATWGNQHAKLFVDGAKVGEGHGELPSEQPGTFWISGTSSKEGNANVIDELRIYDAPLDITSIKARYIAGRRRLVQGQSVTGATPDEVGKRLKTAWLYQDELTQLLVNVDAADLPVPELSELRMNAFLSNADGRQLSALRDQPFNELAVARGTMNTKGMPPGKYQLLVVIRKADSNRPIAQQSLQVERPEAKWLGNTIGQTTEAVAPFTPVQVNGTQVTPWGKQYDVTKALILSQATLEPDKNTRLHPGVGNFWRQAPLLAAPIRLTASLGGNRIALADGSPEVKRTTPSHAVIESTATQGPVRVHNRIRIDDDSIITCDLRLEHSAKDTLSDLRLEIPLKTKFCRWMNWTALAGGREASGAGAIPEGDGVVWSGEFHPHLWLGDDYRGFAYFCDNSRGWHGELTTRNRVTIRRDGDTTLLVLHFVPGTLDTGQPWQTRIGFIATPARPMPPRWRGTELQGNFRIRRIPYAEGYPRQVVYWWTSAFFNDGQSHFSSPRTDTLDLEAIHAAIADNQDKPISHVFYTYPNSYHHPAVRYFYSDWCNRSTTDLLNSLQEGSPPAGTAVDWNSSVCDYWLYQLNTLADLGVDGIYCDDPYTKPSYNNRTGTAFTTADGETRPNYGLYGLRSYFRRLRQMLNSKANHPHMLLHMSNQLTLPFQIYFDSFANGEHLNQRLSQHYIGELSVPEIRAQYMGYQWGNIPFILPEIGSNYRTPENTREMLALMLPHDVLIWVAWCHSKTARQYNQALQKDFQTWADDCRFLPYWEADGIIAGVDETLVVSSYVRKNKVLMIVANWSDTPRTASLTVDWEALTGRRSMKNARCKFDGEPPTLENELLRVPVPPRDLRLVILDHE